MTERNGMDSAAAVARRTPLINLAIGVQAHNGMEPTAELIAVAEGVAMAIPSHAGRTAFDERVTAPLEGLRAAFAAVELGSRDPDGPATTAVDTYPLLKTDLAGVEYVLEGLAAGLGSPAEIREALLDRLDAVRRLRVACRLLADGFKDPAPMPAATFMACRPAQAQVVVGPVHGNRHAKYYVHPWDPDADVVAVTFHRGEAIRVDYNTGIRNSTPRRGTLP